MTQSPIVVWKMKAPEKKPLVRRERPDESRSKVRKGSQKKNHPMKVLSEFENPWRSYLILERQTKNSTNSP